MDAFISGFKEALYPILGIFSVFGDTRFLGFLVCWTLFAVLFGFVFCWVVNACVKLELWYKQRRGGAP